MEPGGSSTMGGMNAQTCAAMSLFLQYLKHKDFSYIRFEGKKLQDFTLFFEDGRKIICESKARKSNFSYSNLKSLLNSILKKNVLSKKDEILIVCTNLDDDLKNYVQWTKYDGSSGNPAVNRFVKKGFSKSQIAILNKVRFWEVSADDHLKAIYSLFNQLINFWLPLEDLINTVDSILVQKIYKGTEKGSVYTREQLYEMINGIRDTAKEYSGYFKDPKKEKQLKSLEKAIKDNSDPIWAEYPLKAFSTEPGLMFYVLDKFIAKKRIDLKKWNKIWNLVEVNHFAFKIFDIFEKNLHSKDNRSFVVSFIDKHIDDLRGFYVDDFFEMDVVKILKKILPHKEKLNEIFTIIQKLLKAHNNDYFYLKNKSGRDYRREQVAEMLKAVYDHSSSSLKKNIYKFCIDNFNLVEDEGEFYFHCPSEIFDIVRDYVSKLKPLPKVILKLVDDLVAQYDRHYEPFKKKTIKKNIYQGAELMGMSGGSSAGVYHVNDRHFVGKILEPVLMGFYKADFKKALFFIYKNCVSTDKDISRDKPDFLNRAALSIILQNYLNHGHKQDLEILKEFVLSRKGIPSKSDLIFQSLLQISNNPMYQKRIKVLVEIFLKKWGLPYSPFIDEIVVNFANSSDKGLCEYSSIVLSKWFSTADYFSKDSLDRGKAVGTVGKIIEKDFDLGVSLFLKFVENDYFVNEYERFDVFQLGHVLNKILRNYYEAKNFDKGIQILDSLIAKGKLSINQQLLLTNGIVNVHEKETVPNGFYKALYDEFIDKFLKGFDDDNAKIVKFLPDAGARVNIVKIAEELAKGGEIAKALRIVQCFIDDPDPLMPEEEKTAKDLEYNEHKRIMDGNGCPTIDTVRGWCAWVLMHCMNMELKKVDNGIDIVIDLTAKLSGKSEKNYYIKHMACFPLARLAQLRLTHIGDGKTLFLDDDLTIALKKAKYIERMAFDLLDEISSISGEFETNIKKELSKNLLHVFGNIRTLNTKDAKLFVDTIVNKFPSESIKEASALLLFYAFYRKDAYKKWKWSVKGFYDDLNDFDDKYFKGKLDSLIEAGNDVVRDGLSWQFFLISDLRNPHDKSDKEVARDFALALFYLKRFLKKFDEHSYSHVYRFIRENIENHFDECYSLWKDWFKLGYTVEDLQSHFLDLESNILLVKERKGDNEFFKLLDMVMKWPRMKYLYNFPKIAVVLVDFPKTDDRVKKVFEFLIELNPDRYYDLKKEWEKK